LNVYLDSSVVLRIVFREPGEVKLPPSTQGFTSSLTVTESLRTLDRLRLRRSLTDTQLALYRGTLLDLLERIDQLALTDEVLARAALPQPTNLGTLDALHLCTAILLRDQLGQAVTLATHAQKLATAAAAHGFAVIG
jgi:predicted nucleic acid-binding protein